MGNDVNKDKIEELMCKIEDISIAIEAVKKEMKQNHLDLYKRWSNWAFDLTSLDEIYCELVDMTDS